jgi:hypothetical protein
MSRFTKDLEEERYVAYGFDHATGYFIQVFEAPDEDGEDVLSVDECSMFSKLTKGKMVDLMQEHELPQEHIDQVLMDLPIV